ncbi:MAG: T9SS C-terminal target domain-containing protein [Sphingobacteriia bacterium]|nr:T9SS C-terminal target domain-containing protein [Sphingobacteriia bacterium]
MNTSLTLLNSIPNRLPMAIRAMLLTLALLVSGSAIVHAQPTLLVDPAGAGGFELGNSFAANGWTVSNGANNPWILGTANTTAPFAGNSAYVSTDGTTPGYTITTAASNFFWRDIVVPAGQERVNVSFNWLSGGESTWDLWQVFFVPNTVTPVGSTTHPGSGLSAIPSTLPGAVFVAGSNLQTAAVQTFTGAAYLPAGSYRLVFHWKNDGTGGATPGASFDNISVSSQAPATFTSVATGNWSNPATWGGSVPSSADNIIVAAGHTVTIDAVGQAAGNVTVGGTLTYGATPTEFQAFNLTIESSGLVNVFQSTTGKTLRVSGNLVNNGRLNTLASSTANGTLNFNGTAPQTVSGTGVWGGTVSSTTSTNEVGVIGILSITNTSTSVPRVNYTMGGTLRVRSTFTVNGAVNLNGSTWIAGNYAAMGTLTFSNNGGFINGTYGRWYTNAQTGTTITAGVDPSTAASSSLSLFPMLNSNGVPRYCWITRTSSTTTGNTAGEIRVTYTNEGTALTGNAFTDGAYNVSNYWPGTWSISTASGYVYASGTHTLTAVAPSLFAPSSSNARLMVNGGTFVGNHQAGTGTPGAQRTGLTTAQLTSTNGFVMGIGSTDLCSPSVAAINENFDSYGTGNMVPFCWDRIVVGSASQTISSTSPASGTRNIWQSSSPGNVSYVVLPQMTDMLNVSSGNYRLKFKARTATASGQLAVGYFPSTSLVASSFVLITNVPLTNITYGSETVVNIPAGIPAGSRLAIANLGVSTESHYWDDVVYEALPACFEPTSPVLASTGTSGMQFNFTAPSTAPSNGYDVYFSTSNVAPTAGTSASPGASASGTSGAITGLTPNTVYFVWIRSNCGSSGVSAWSGPIAFRTQCEVFNLPWFESFEATQGTVTCWTGNFASSGGTNGWQYLRMTPGGSAPSNQNPALPDTLAMRFPSYSITSGISYSLNSPLFNPSTQASVLSFNYAYATYATENDRLEILSSADGGANYSSLEIMNGGPTGPLNTGGVTTTSFVPTTSQWGTKRMRIPAGSNRISFKGISAFGNHIYLDNISMTPCQPISSSISASICQGQTYAFGAQSLNAAGSYSRTVTAANGCDSVINLTLNVLPTSATAQTASICQGQTFAFGQQNLIGAGTYTRTLVAANGCDSVITLTLEVRPIATGTVNASICSGSSYAFGPQSYSTAGTYTMTTTGSNGCDSVTTLNLTILALPTATVNQTVPYGGSFTVCGQVYNASGTYTKVCSGAALNGCDSIVTLNLTVQLPPAVVISNANVCQGDTVIVPVSLLRANGVGAISLAINYDAANYTFVDAVNINSNISTVLVNASVFNGVSQVRAGWYATSNPVNLNGTLFGLRFVAPNAPGSSSLSFDLLTPGNCEIADFDAIPLPDVGFTGGQISVTAELNTAISASICSGSSYTFGAQTLTAPGIYNRTLVSSTGCDSIITLNLDVLSHSSASISASICQGSTFAFGSQNVSVAGTYTRTIPASNGCDSVITLNLEVRPLLNSTSSASICQGSTYTWGGTSYTVAGTYTQTAVGSNGCDSTATLVLTTRPVATSIVTQSVPFGGSITVCGQVYNTSGTFTKVCAGAAVNGCDSVVTINLTVLPQCVSPSALVVSSITTSGASFAWTAGSTETAWEISIQTTTGTPTGNGTSITTNPYVATGLASNTLYRVYLRSVCSPADKSLWIGPISFRTLCNVFTLPLFESFETAQGTSSCWSGNFAAGSTPGWQLVRLTAGSAPSNQTPALPDTLAMRIPFYAIESGSFSLNTPAFTPNPIGAVLTFNYAYAAYSAVEIDKLEIMASTDGGATYTSLEIMNGGPSGPLNTGGTTTASFVPTSAQWGLKTVNLPANTNRVSFKGISEYGNNLYLDNIRVANPPPCSAPTAPAVVANSVGSSTASISWTAPASAPANGYQLFVSTSTTAPDAASVPTRSSSASPAALTGLAPLTTYNVWVRSSCAIGTSSWVGPVSFTTTCLESNIPTSENFDSYVATGGTANTGTAVPPCWSRANGTSTSSAWRVFALTGSNIGSTSGDNILASFPTVTTAKNDWAFTTGYNLVGGTTYTLRFKVRAPGNGPNRERLGIYLANARTSTAMLAGPRIFNDSLLQASGWQSKTARLTPTASGVYYLGIRAYSVANAGYIGIDDWSLEVTTSEIAGTLKYQGGASVLDNSTVTLSGAVSASATTTASGAFAFTGLGNGAVTLTASTNKAWGGITATDALATTRHYQGIGLVSGLNLAAADVNLSALVNATDALMIINRYNGTRNNFPAGDWKFESKNFNLNLSEITTDLFGIAIGDVNNSYSPAAGRQFIGLNLAEGGVQSISDENWMDVRVDRALEMGALSLALDIPSGVRIEQVVSNLEGGRFDYNVHNGQLRLTWFDVAGVKLVAGQSLFRMRIASDRSVAVSDWTVAEGSEIADPLAQVMEMVGLRMPSLRGLQADLVATVYPNPTQGMSSVRLNLPAAGELKLRLVDVLGKVVMSQTVTSQALNTELPVDMSSLAAGRYELQIELNAGGRNYRTHLPVQRRD